MELFWSNSVKFSQTFENLPQDFQVGELQIVVLKDNVVNITINIQTL